MEKTQQVEPLAGHGSEPSPVSEMSPSLAASSGVSPRSPDLLPQSWRSSPQSCNGCRKLLVAPENSWVAPAKSLVYPANRCGVPAISWALPQTPGPSREFLRPPAHSQASAAKLFAHKPQTKTTKSHNYE